MTSLFSSSSGLAPSRPPRSWASVSLYQSSCVSPVELTDGRGGGAKSYDGEKAWSSINHPILSDVGYGLWCRWRRLSLSFSTTGALLRSRKSLQSVPLTNSHLQQLQVQPPWLQDEPPVSSTTQQSSSTATGSASMAPGWASSQLYYSTVIFNSYRPSLHGSRVSLQSAQGSTLIFNSYRVSLHGSRMSLQSAPLLNSHLQQLQG
jgi:hypothetical protein